jgi:hypothetical protein
MRTWGGWRADRAAAREYRATLEQLDQGLAALEASGHGPGTVAYEQAWHDRMGFAANPAGPGGCVFPQPPNIVDVHRAQQAAHEALSEPGAQYETAVTAREQTEAAFLAALDRQGLPETEAGQ